MGVWILLTAPLLAAGIGGRRLLMLRDRAQEAWSMLETELTSRHERIQGLLEAIGETAAGESAAAAGLADSLREARDAPGIPARAEAENELSSALRRLRSTREKDDGLNQSRIRALCEELSGMEEKTVLRARSYNQQVMAWNQALHQLPWSVIARVCRFRPIEYFVLDDPVPRPERHLAV